MSSLAATRPSGKRLYDRRFLEACDEVVVLLLDGWRESIGVKAEIEIVRELGKPVSFLFAIGDPREQRSLDSTAHGSQLSKRQIRSEHDNKTGRNLKDS